MNDYAPTLPDVSSYEYGGRVIITGPPPTAPEDTTAVRWIRDRDPFVPTGYAAGPATRAVTDTPPSPLDSLRETMEATYSLLSLPAGWNGYDAVTPDPGTVQRALTWLQQLYRGCERAGQPWHRPNVTASAEGEVVYEWWADDRVLTVYVEADGIQYLKFGRGEGASLREHGSAEDSSTCVRLMRWFSE